MGGALCLLYIAVSLPENNIWHINRDIICARAADSHTPNQTLTASSPIGSSQRCYERRESAGICHTPTHGTSLLARNNDVM